MPTGAGRPAERAELRFGHAGVKPAPTLNSSYMPLGLDAGEDLVETADE
jgi:hypothetical protein